MRKDWKSRSSDPFASRDAEYESRHVAQNPWDASVRDARDDTAREKKKKKKKKRGSGYFSQWKQTRYVPGNFNRLHFDVSTRWTFPIRPDGDSWRQKSATTCLEVMSGRVKLYQQESNSATMRVSDGSRET